MTLDLDMPGTGGLAVLESIRAIPELADLKVLVISDLPADELDQARAARADDVLTRPFKNKQLVEKVARLAGVQ